MPDLSKKWTVLYDDIQLRLIYLFIETGWIGLLNRLFCLLQIFLKKIWLFHEDYCKNSFPGRHKQCLPLLPRSQWQTKAGFYLGNQAFIWLTEHRWGVTCGMGTPLLKVVPENLYQLGWGLPHSCMDGTPAPCVSQPVYSSPSPRPCAIKAVTYNRW